MINLKKQQQIEVHSQMDLLQIKMEKMKQVDCLATHIFTPGLYTRELFMPAGTDVISKIHGTAHPYVVSMGEVAVYNTENEVVGLIVAPYIDITVPGTRRLLRTKTDVLWTTFHVSPLVTGEEMNWPIHEQLELVRQIETEIIIKHNVHLSSNQMEEIPNE